MRVAKRILFMFMALALLNGTAVAKAEPSQVQCVVGYSLQGIADVDVLDAAAALRVWAREMGEPYGFHVETVLYASVNKMIRDFENGKLDFVVVNIVDYLRRASVIGVKPEMARSKHNRTTIKYLLLTRADDASGGASGLQNKSLVVLKTNHLGLMYLNVYLMRAGLPDAERFFSSVSYKPKESQAILAVFFGQADACLVTDLAFRTMTELNPQVGKKLQVIAESQDLIESVGFFRRDYPAEYKETAIKGMQGGIKSHERGKQIMLLFNVDQMERIKDSDIAGTRKLLADYDRFRKRK